MTRIEEIKDKLTPLSVKSMSLDDARYLVSRIEAAEKLASTMKDIASETIPDHIEPDSYWRRKEAAKALEAWNSSKDGWESGEAGLLRGRL